MLAPLALDYPTMGARGSSKEQHVDTGRWVMLGVNEYPELKQPDVEGSSHIGWAVRVADVGKSAYNLREVGQSTNSIVPFAQMAAYKILSC